MYLSKLGIRNFRNFEAVDIPLAGNVVLLGENRVGKSNLLFAIRLVIDPTLPDSAGSLSCQISGMAVALNQTLKLRCTLNLPISTVTLPSKLC
ncbi:AAA family ATPase [Enterobacter asburiae]|uniref:AAA family ATPase n=1 Tax=Enterobacter asburiae TaxID=61645 RepID=UPI003BEC93B0